MRKIWLYVVGLVLILGALMILKMARDSDPQIIGNIYAQMHWRSSVESSNDPTPSQYVTLSNNDVKRENNLQLASGKVASPSASPSATGSKAKLLTSSLTSSTTNHDLKSNPTKKPTGSPRQVNSTEMNSTHVRNRLMEPINTTDYVKNIYFSIKTTSKYHGTRLPVLMVTWFQAVKDKVSLL